MSSWPLELASTGSAKYSRTWLGFVRYIGYRSGLILNNGSLRHATDRKTSEMHRPDVRNIIELSDQGVPLVPAKEAALFQDLRAGVT